MLQNCGNTNACFVLYHVDVRCKLHCTFRTPAHTPPLSARAQQLRVHSVKTLLHGFPVGHHFESLELTVPPAVHKRRNGGSRRRVQVDAVLCMNQHALVVTLKVCMSVSLVTIPDINSAGQSTPTFFGWPLRIASCRSKLLRSCGDITFRGILVAIAPISTRQRRLLRRCTAFQQASNHRLPCSSCPTW